MMVSPIFVKNKKRLLFQLRVFFRNFQSLVLKNNISYKNCLFVVFIITQQNTAF